MADESARDQTLRIETAIDRYWDAASVGRMAVSDPTRDQIEQRLAATIRRVHALAGQPLPEPERAEQLWRELMTGYAPTVALRLTATYAPVVKENGRSIPAPRSTARRDRRPGRLSAGLSFVATAALIAAVLAMIFFVFFRNDHQNIAFPPLQGTPTVVATPDTHSWPMWGGNPARTKVSAGRGPESEPVVLWTYPPEGAANPGADTDRGALADGILYLPTSTGLLAIDASTGKELWQVQGYGEVIVIDGDGLIVHGNILGDARSLARLQRSDGALLWEAEQDSLQPGWNPVVADGVGYTPSGFDLLAFNPSTGDELWRFTLDAPASRGAAVAGGQAVLGDENGKIYGISTQGGDILWSYQTDALTVAHPSLANGMVYVTGIGGAKETYYAIDATTGALAWSFVAPSGNSFHTAAIDKSTVYLPCDDGTLFALDASTGAIRWQLSTGVAQVDSPALVGGVLYFATETGFAYAINPSTGAQLWTLQLDSGTGAAAMVVDGVYYLSTDNGTVYAIGNGASSGAESASPSPLPSPEATGATVASEDTGRPDVQFVWAAIGGDDPLKNPGAIELDPLGRLWVSDIPGRFLIFDLDGNLVETWGTAGHGDGQFSFEIPGVINAGAITFASDGSFFVADIANARVQSFDRDRNFVAAWGAKGAGDGQFLAPSGIAIGSDGSIIVSDYLRSDVQRFGPDGTFIGMIGGRGSGDGQFDGPANVTVDSDGNIYVAEIGNHRVQEFDPSGQFLRTIGGLGAGDGQFSEPTDIAFDEEGNIYISDQGLNRIDVFAPGGRFLFQWGEQGSGDGQFNAPAGLAVNRGGAVYVMDWYGDRIEKFKITGPFPAPVEATPTS